MCGITGYIGKKAIKTDAFYAAHQTLRHRGPDDEGFILYQENRLANFRGRDTISYFSDIPDLNSVEEASLILGHRRLSILDLSWHGHQPMKDETGRYCLVYNGEIYNYIEIRNELRGLGHKFESNTDTEVVLKAFIQWGENCFSRFNGMWALALLDLSMRTLILSRDRFGIKPLYYSQWNGGFFFASEVKFFRQLHPLTVDEQVAAEYIANCYLDHREQTLYSEVKQLLPAHQAILNVDTLNLKICPYWSISNVSVKQNLSLEDATREFDHLFTDAITLRMRSDVPVGSLLSGGLDSSAIVCNLHHHDRFPKQGFYSFSADFEEKRFSEKNFVEVTGKRCKGLVSQFTYPNIDDIAENLRTLLWYQDFPFRSFSVHAQNAVYRLVKESSSVGVLLNGQGGDELFGGYHNHYLSSIESDLLNGKWTSAYNESKWLTRHRSQSRSRLLSTLIQRILFRKFAKLCKSGERKLHPVFKKQKIFNTPRFHPDPFQDSLQFNLCFSALPEYLRYEDRNSMAYSKESRLPFLDYRLVEWAFSLPNNFKILNGVNKRIVRLAVRTYTPKAVVERKDKMGFVTPQEVWQKTKFSSLLESAINELELTFLDRRKIRNQYIKYLAGDKSLNWGFWWRYMCFYLWLQINNNPSTGK